MFVLLGIHTLDHGINQPSRSVPALSGVVGLIGFAIVAAALILAIRRSGLAPQAAVLAGAATLAGFVVVHLLPDWTPLSDPFWDFDPNALSWALLIAPMAASLGLAAEGARRMRARHPALAAAPR